MLKITDYENQLQKELIDYYEAFELLLDVSREYGVYKTHFGIMEHPLDAEYCWFRSITRPDLFSKYNRHIRAGLLKFHLKLFYSDNYGREYDKVLDVGFGTGGTMLSLASEWPEIEIHGININKTQYDIATKKCLDIKNIQTYLGDFLNFEFQNKYDLVYFIESAFHIKDKEKLVDKLANICTGYSDVYITDIVYSEKFAAKVKKNEIQSTIFEYCSLNDWIQLFENSGFEFIEFEDLSEQVANVITITTPPEDFKNEFVLPIVRSYKNKEIYTSNIMNAFTSYSKLQRLLKMKVLKYGIMRFRKLN